MSANNSNGNSSQFPLKEADFTQEWLISALTSNSSNKFQPIKSAKLEQMEMSGRMSNIRRIQLEYEPAVAPTSKGATLLSPSTLILKFGLDATHASNGPFNMLMRKGCCYSKEVRVYNELSAKLEEQKQKEKQRSILPKVYYAAYDKQTDDFIIVMEDLGKAYFQLGGASVEQATTVLNSIAKFQARWWHQVPKTQKWGSLFQGTLDDELMTTEKLNWLPLTFSFLYHTRMILVENPNTEQLKEWAAYTPENVVKLSKGFDIAWEDLKKMVLSLDLSKTKLPNSEMKTNVEKIDARQQKDAKNEQGLGFIGQQFAKACKYTTEQAPRTIVHGDFRIENMIFFPPKDSAVVFVDWQCCTIGCGLADIAMFVAQCLEPDVRRKNEMDLLKQYHKVLTQNVGKNQSSISFEEDVLRGYQTCLWMELNFVCRIAQSFKISGGQQNPRFFDLGLCIFDRVLSAVVDHHLK